MNIFSVDFSVNELQFIRQSLDLVTIKGTDAKFLAGLQIKLESELIEIQNMLQQEEIKKKEELEKLIQQETSKKTK
jgi:hypothetical protein